MMTRRERLHAGDALMHWFQSQDISPSDAALLMAEMIGVICGKVFTDVDQRNTGIAVLMGYIKRASG
jgi:hypothetical protein